MRKWKKTLAAMIAITVITMGITSLLENAEAKSLPVKVTINDSHVELMNEPLLINGAVLLPLREIGTLMNSKTTYFSEGKSIIVNSPTTHIEMRLGSKQTMLNGKSYTLPTIPKNINGTVYVPVRFVTEGLGAGVQWFDKEQRVNLAFNQRYIFAEKGVKSYWVDKKDGKLYLSVNAKAATFVADTDVNIWEYPTFSIDTLSSNVDLLKIHDNYGEPHLNDDIYKLLIVDEKLKLETKVQYWGIHPIQNIDWSTGKNALLLNGTQLIEVNRDGSVKATHDLKTLTGLDASSFQVELYDEEYMVVRPHDTGWLTLIDRKTNKATRLADVLLDKDKLEIYRTIDIRDSYFYQWDGLKVIERVGSSLLLSHVYFMDRTETKLTYNLTEN
ncbi:stalk domain-containing protein [Paenibacillus luteus]|uniref:stalk domain-containing protein n=1 Tax=Paenibacillus luteus TaxID=2545753 RepID=UPI001143455B|nr:stalk domain-containing protein [Paenibacillus luteus]